MFLFFLVELIDLSFVHVLQSGLAGVDSVPPEFFALSEAARKAKGRACHGYLKQGQDWRHVAPIVFLRETGSVPAERSRVCH